MTPRRLTIRDCSAKGGRLGVGYTHHPQMRPGRPACWCRRPAFAYVMALGTASIVAVIGLSAIISIRLEGRTNNEEICLAEARTVALSGLEHALATIKANPTWRTDYVHGVVVATHSLGEGGFSWTLFDEGDGDLSDDSNDPVDVLATGVVGPAVYAMRATLDFSQDDVTFVVFEGSKTRDATPNGS